LRWCVDTLIVVKPKTLISCPNQFTRSAHRLSRRNAVPARLDGGKERTPKEYATLFERSGLRLTGVTSTNSPIAIIEARLQ